MADEAVLAVQKWLNKTYSSVSGFTTAPRTDKLDGPLFIVCGWGYNMKLVLALLVKDLAMQPRQH